MQGTDAVPPRVSGTRQPGGARVASAFKLGRARFLAPALLFTACSFAPPPSLPEPVADLPDSFADGRGTEDHDAREWWNTFQDPVLNTVVDSVLATNFDLAEAVARVQQARAQARIARAALFPALQASGSASDQDSPTNAGFGPAVPRACRWRRRTPTGRPSVIRPLRGDQPIPWVRTLRTSSTLWGRARNDSKAAAMQYLASESDYRAARIAVLAETITTYFEIVDLRRRTTLARETVDVLLDRVGLAQTRYDRGLVTSFELYQVRQELRDTQAGLPQLESQLVNAEGRLAILLGGFRAKLDAVLPDSLEPATPGSRVRCGCPRRPSAPAPRRTRGRRASRCPHGTRSAHAGPSFFRPCPSTERSVSRPPTWTVSSTWTSGSATWSAI